MGKGDNSQRKDTKTASPLTKAEQKAKKRLKKETKTY